MEEVTGVFIGFKKFTSSKNGKNYNVLSFVFIDVDEKNQNAKYFVKDIFVKDDVYDEFIYKYQLLNEVSLKREIVNDTVRYYI